MKKRYTIEAKGDGTASVNLMGDIGGWGMSAQWFLRDALATGAKTLKVLVQSPGGDPMEAAAMINGLKAKGVRVEATVLGLAASAATLFLAGCDHVSMPSNTFQMIHQPSAGIYGTADELQNMADALRAVRGSMEQFYAARWKGTPEELTAALNKDTWLTAEQCLELGLCDEVTPAVEIEASAIADHFDEALIPEPMRALVAAMAKPTPADPPAPAAAAAEPAPVPATLAEQISAAAGAAGFAEFAPQWALRARSLADVQGLISTAREITAVARVVGLQAEAAPLIKQGKSLDEARDHLAAQLAAGDPRVDPTPPAPAAAGATAPVAAALDPQALLDRYNNQRG